MPSELSFIIFILWSEPNLKPYLNRGQLHTIEMIRYISTSFHAEHGRCILFLHGNSVRTGIPYKPNAPTQL